MFPNHETQSQQDTRRHDYGEQVEMTKQDNTISVKRETATITMLNIGMTWHAGKDNIISPMRQGRQGEDKDTDGRTAVMIN